MSTNEAAADVPASDSTSGAPVQAEPTRENHGAEEKQVMTIEDYKSALEKVRREAAKYRTEKQGASSTGKGGQGSRTGQLGRAAQGARAHGGIGGGKGRRRGRTPVTTVSPKAPDHRPDLVQRNFRAHGPGRLWVADITYVRALSGFVYTAFVVDVFSRKIVGVATRSTMRTDGGLGACVNDCWGGLMATS